MSSGRRIGPERAVACRVEALEGSLITMALSIRLSFRRNFHFGRYWGALLTFVVIITEALMCLYQGYVGHLMWFAG